MTLFNNKYRIESTRLLNWDYGWNGYYFVTICTKDRGDILGKIIKGKIMLNDFGNFAKKFWQTIPEHFPFTILDEFVVMPDHVHGIIIIDKNDNIQNDPGQREFGKPVKQSVSAIIGSYKSIVTRTINKENPDNKFEWQSGFYDRIIRDRDELNNVRTYIINNPLQNIHKSEMDYDM
jgi:REP element-mobilizing transposase RayT